MSKQNELAQLADAVTVDSGKVGIGTSSPSRQLHLSGSTPIIRLTDTDTNAYGEISSSSSDGNLMFFADQGNTQDNTTVRFYIDSTERMRINSDGSLIVGGTVYEGSTTSNASSGFMNTNGFMSANVTNDFGMQVNRTGTDGKLFNFRKNGSDAGSISVWNGNIGIANANTRLEIDDAVNAVFFTNNTTGGLRDNTTDLGKSNARLDNIYATNGTIQTSDFNEKQDIASLTATEMLVGKRISALFKTFRWKDKVVEKGDNARTHTGVIAQDVQAAFTAEGLDAGDYSLFTSSTWWEHLVDVPASEADEENGTEARDAYTRTDTYDTEVEAPEGATERTRLGIRYPELLSFVAAYNEQRFASIEARLTALEDV